jgi:phosphoribosyl-AMP cyclohydrolase
MKPIGLTMKKGRNRYQSKQRGELMLIHECVECNTLSINRIAADDDPETIMEVFQASLALCHTAIAECKRHGIDLLKAGDADILATGLYGRNVEIPMIVGM